MGTGERVNRVFMNVEWRLSLLITAAGVISSFALPAWAVRATNLFGEYSPLSWVVAGFLGLFVAAIIFGLLALARTRWIRSGYDRNLYERSGFVDPMAATFENKRIFLADFALPSDQYIFGKTFINCEIIGPANLFLKGNYQVHEQRLPRVDAVVLNGDREFYNGITVENCTFRACSFKRITLMMMPHEYQQYRTLEWLNWISRPPDEQPTIPGLINPALAESGQNQLPSGREAEGDK